MKLEKTVLVSCDAEYCAYQRGGSLGPGALLTAARQQRKESLLHLDHKELHESNRELSRLSNSPNAKYLASYAQLFKRLSKEVSAVLEEGNFPLCLTGDHSQGAAVLHGVKSAFPEARLGAIWIDAHADLHSPFTTPSGNVHGMPLAIALGVDNLNNKRNDPASEIRSIWSDLKEGPGNKPVLQPRDLVFLGVRDIEPEEASLIQELDIKCLDVEECRDKGMDRVVEETLAYLEGCDMIMLSFDVDSMDPELVSDGTGTPVPGGFLETESTELLEGLLKSERIIGLEITEINPTLDTKGNVMAETCLRILNNCFLNHSTNASLLSYG